MAHTPIVRSESRKAGHTPSLIAAFLYFDVSFMAWVLLGPLGPFVAETYKLSATQKGFLVALPLLAGSVFRPILGVLGDVLGPRRAGIVGLTVTLVPLILGWRFASSLHAFYFIGFLLGIAGASFAVALPLAGIVGEGDAEFDSALPRQSQGCRAARQSKFGGAPRQTSAGGT